MAPKITLKIVMRDATVKLETDQDQNSVSSSSDDDLCNRISNRIHNKWTREQRLALCLLFKATTNWIKIRRVFNQFFGQGLRLRGFRHGRMPESSLKTYFAELMYRRFEEYRIVFERSPSKIEVQELDKLRESIMPVWRRWISAEEEETFSDERLKEFAARRSRCKKSQATSRVAEFVRPIQTDFAQSNQDRHSPAAIVGSCEDSLKHSLMGTGPDPPILIRVHSSASQGINDNEIGFFAEAFSALDCPVSHRPNTLEKLLHVACPHLNLARIKQPGSPLISVTSSLAWALWKAQESPEETIITFFDTRCIQRHTAIWRAAPIVSELKQRRLATFRYLGHHEYLVWGEVKPEAIIAQITLKELKQVTTKVSAIGALLELSSINPGVPLKNTVFSRPEVTLDHKLGVGIGGFARTLNPYVVVHETYLSDIVSLFFTNWLRSVEDWTQWRQNLDFVEGIEHGIREAGKIHSDTQRSRFLGVFINDPTQSQKPISRLKSYRYMSPIDLTKKNLSAIGAGDAEGDIIEGSIDDDSSEATLPLDRVLEEEQRVGSCWSYSPYES